ncbi:hypothetical protein OAJ42_00460 [Flavobacteriales bacterium]|nr:hypothetical protein [Flavobacteriales bacterium]
MKKLLLLFIIPFLSFGQNYYYDNLHHARSEPNNIKFNFTDNNCLPAKIYVDKNDKLVNGKVYKRISNKDVLLGKMTNGKKVGKWNEFTRKGVLIKELNYFNGKLDGFQLHYYDSGELSSKREYSNGCRTQISTFYCRRGKVWARYHWKNGKMFEGNTSYYDQRCCRVYPACNADFN